MSHEHSVDAGAYVLGSLRGAERAAFADHLGACAACRTAVEELAGLPELLSRVSAELTAADPPPSVLARLLEEVRRDRLRRRRLVAGGLAAAVLAAVVLSGQVVRMPWTGDGPAVAAAAGDAASVELVPVTDVPVSATVELTEVRWGTRIDVTCRYAVDGYIGTAGYALVLYDADGHSEQVATWTAVPGEEVTVPAATVMPMDSILRVEMLSGGAVVLSGTT